MVLLVLFLFIINSVFHRAVDLAAAFQNTPDLLLAVMQCFQMEAVIVTGVHLNGQIGCCWRQDQQTEFDWRQQQNRPENLLNVSDSHQSLQSNSDCYHKQPLNFCGNDVQAGHFYGTGDIFSALLYGRLLQGWSLETAVENATDAMELAIQQTAPLLDNERRFGLRLDHLIHYVSKHKRSDFNAKICNG